jgi:hypothetical protein
MLGVKNMTMDYNLTPNLSGFCYNKNEGANRELPACLLSSNPY